MKFPDVAIRKILYPTDLSDSARYAFAYAVSLANQYEAAITILHVLTEIPRLDERIIGYVDAEQWRKIKADHEKEARHALIGKQRERTVIQDALHRFAESAKAGSAFETDEVVVLRGNPVELILQQCQERNCDLIVMGTHGTGSLADVMLGSTAQRVLRRSPKPVLVIRLPEGGAG